MTALLFALLLAQPPVPPNDSQNDATAADATEVLARWTFDDPVRGTWKGPAKIEARGPQPPEFTGFPAGNKAAHFDGAQSIVLKESDGVGEKLRFRNGETISLEAWVSVDSMKNGENIYLVGKGRNRNPRFAAENQNWALRLRVEQGSARVSFLFRSAETKDAKSDFHRWTSTLGIGAADGWHHVAVTYTFGKPDSITGFVDGVPTDGTWDMGGKTARAPVTDADDVVVGTGNGGGAANSFRGLLDNVAVHRGKLPDDVLARRYTFVPPPPVVDAAKLPPGRILVELCEKGVPESNTWPNRPPGVTEQYEEPVFGFFAVPHKYIETGIRADRANPFLMRASAMIQFPPGKHRLMIRGRGASHLYVNHKLLLSTPFMPSDDSGHQPAPKTYLDLGPDFHFAPPGNRETWCHFESTGGPVLVSLETLVGNAVGKRKRRPELGETVVAVSWAGSDQWELLTPGTRRVPFTDAGMAAYEAEREQVMDAENSRRRAEQRARHQPEWDRRREFARTWLSQQPASRIPAGPPANPIDRFLNAKLDEVRRAMPKQADGLSFHKQVLPILEARCYSCHSGSKVKGGLKLDSAERAKAGGDSDVAAVVPGKPDQSELIKRILATDDSVMPPKGERLTEREVTLLKTWIRDGASWPAVHAERLEPTSPADDLAFLRRLALDTVGVVPTVGEIEQFRADRSPDRSIRAIDRYLADPRWADHQMGYWLDVLAENPNILNPTLNNTGPFRWWLYESFRDNKPFDLMVTELVTLKGSVRYGGPAGFGIASQNDAPMAAKGTVISTAFLGVEMKCARCHDAPFHESKQEQLFQLAAMLDAKPVGVPATSSVPLDAFHKDGRTPLISVTLKPGSKVEPVWPFPQFVDPAIVKPTGTPREQLAALLTDPRNQRFAQVIANRIWKRLMGRGLVEPVDDWEKGTPTHPELLAWLGREFTANGYDQKALQRLILSSDAYRRAADPAATVPNPLYAAPMRRRLAAEQIVDSLFHAAGKPMNTEEVSLDIDGMRDQNNSITLGKARRSWNLTSTSNERDRPALSLPRVQAVCDVLEAFGWRASRQDPVSARDASTYALQPAILANGAVGVWLTRLSDDHGITALALQNQPLDQLIRTLYLRFLTREPTADEQSRAKALLANGYEARIVVPSHGPPGKRERARFVSWSNHLTPEATEIKKELEAAARRGDPPTQKLQPDWRERLEDLVWSLVNSPEMIFAP